MADWRSFLFYRYELYIDGEKLNARAQLIALKEMQGKYVPHSAKGAKEGLFDSILMRPRSFTMDDGNLAITFSVGQAIGSRVRVTYDHGNDDIDRKHQKDDSLRYADFIAVPTIGVFAVSDRSGDEYLPGSTAAHRFRSIFRWQNDDTDADAVVTPAAKYEDVQRAISNWTISTFSFTIRPFNPHSPGIEAERLGNALKERQVSRAYGKWQADPGEGIKPDDEMKAIIDLTEAGYGQTAIKGETDDGVKAEIRKSPFYEDKEDNLESLERPKDMRSPNRC